MCGRYVIKSKISEIEKRFDIDVPEGMEVDPSFNVAPGDMAPVVASDSPRELSMMRFGMQPSWANKAMLLFNARSEGDRNKDNDPHYHGKLGIVDKPSFRKPIRSQRCLVIADAFIEGTTKEKLDKPHVVYIKHKEKQPFAFAGLWDEWVDTDTGEILRSFSIVTTTPNELLQRIPHHRSPVILRDREEENLWLDIDAPLPEVLSVLRPYPGEMMNAYPIDPIVKKSMVKSMDLMRPVGQRLTKEYDYVFDSYLELHGMGHTTARDRRKDEDTGEPQGGEQMELF